MRRVPRWRRAALVCICMPALALLGAAGAPGAAEPADWSAPRSVPQFETSRQLSDALDELRRRSWALYSDASGGRDARGRTLREDTDQWLMAPPTARRLDELLKRAQEEERGPHPQELRKTLAEAGPLIEQETYRAFVLATYWGYQGIVAAHASTLDALATRLPGDDGAARRERVDAFLRPPGLQLETAMAVATQDIAQQDAAAVKLAASLGAAIRAYNDERGKLALAVSAHERATRAEPLVRTRATPCPASLLQTSGREHPSLLEVARDLEPYYPPAAKEARFEGAVVVEADVAASGCIGRATVYDTSGVAELDEAALRWTLDADQMHPAEQNSRPVAGVLRFRVKFALDK